MLGITSTTEVKLTVLLVLRPIFNEGHSVSIQHFLEQCGDKLLFLARLDDLLSYFLEHGSDIKVYQGVFDEQLLEEVTNR